MSIAAATLSWTAKGRRKIGDIGDGLARWVSLRGFAERRGCCCTPRKCTDEVIADVSLQNPKASKISNFSLWEEEEKKDVGDTKRTSAGISVSQH